jgi:DNA-binding NarL/FixJ family response regulator
MNIVLIDDHTLFRESLKRLLEAEAGWVVVGQYGRAGEALAAIARGLPCDVALIDYELEGHGAASVHGLQVAADLRRLRPGVPILMVTAGMEYGDVLHAMQEEKVGIFLKNEPAEELLVAMRRTVRGELWVSSGVALSIVAQQSGGPPATPELPFTVRERTVLGLVLEGLSNKEIGAQLELSESSVKAVLQKLFEKAGVRSRSQLVRFAVELQPNLAGE